MRTIALLIVAVLLAIPNATASSGTTDGQGFFASPTGSPSGNGSQDSPWDLATALCGGPNSASCGGDAAQVVQPGDTVWLRGGDYYGTFSGKLSGAFGNPITVRSYPGEWAKLDSYLTWPLSNSPTASTADCTIRLDNAAGFPSNSVVHVGVEQILLISLSGNEVTNCLRGYNGTPVVDHQVGEIVALSGHVLTVDGTDVVYRDFEVTDSNPNRVFLTRGDPSNQRGGEGVLVNASRTKFINLVIHDAQDGMFLATSAVDTEVSGVILFNNGHVDPVRGHGHGMYIQNQYGSKIFTDVISFNNYATGMKAFGVNAYANNVEFRGVISFNNGSPGSYVGTPALAEPSNPQSVPISPSYRETNLYVGTEINPPQNIVMMNNFLYHSANTLVGSGTMGLGYTSMGASNFSIQNNYVVGGHLALFIAGVQNSTITNNVFLSRPPIDAVEGLLVMAGLDLNPGTVDFSNNTYYDLNGASPFRVPFSMISRGIPNCCRNQLGGGLLAFSDSQSGISGNASGSGWVQWTGYDKTSSYIEGSLPTENVVVVRPNQYEAGRANIAIYNWQNQATVSVDLSSAGFVDGDPFEVRDVQNYFGEPVATGTYATNNPIVQIPMGDSNSAVTPPVGAPFAPAHTDREFGAFVVKKP